MSKQEEIEAELNRQLEEFVGEVATSETFRVMNRIMSVALSDLWRRFEAEPVSFVGYQINGVDFSVDLGPVPPQEEPELSPRAKEILKLLQADLAHLNCDCGANKAQTTHSDWCSSKAFK